jgi:hypothetical protein
MVLSEDARQKSVLERFPPLGEEGDLTSIERLYTLNRLQVEEKIRVIQTALSMSRELAIKQLLNPSGKD